ncbi:MAG: hypothetical protein KDC95_09120 [Planctomycetes bacterium]|nr:hypothetical protein [Planctomycetota bacterium]
MRWTQSNASTGMHVFLLIVCSALTPCDKPVDRISDPDRIVRAARSWLIQRYAETKWIAEEAPTPYRAGIRALAALALAREPKARASVLAAARELAAESTETTLLPYSKACVAVALSKIATVSIDEQDEPDREALRNRARVLAEECLGSTDFECRETCLRALALVALATAKRAGAPVDETRMATWGEEIRARALPSGEFHGHDFPSPGHGATALACEALTAIGQGTSRECVQGLEWLERGRLREKLSSLRMSNIGGYLRGFHLFELRAHCAALHNASRSSKERVLDLVRKHLSESIADDGHLDSRYGPIFGTALLVLTLDPQ